MALDLHSKNCARHCWCAYEPYDDLIVQVGAEHIVTLLKETDHDHGDQTTCIACLNPQWEWVKWF